MNTVKSFWMGLGTLCAAGGGAYYVAKKSINADRQARLEEQRKKKSMIESLEYSQNVPSKPGTSSAMGGGGSWVDSSASAPPRTDHVGSPSQEHSNDPAPTRHAPETEQQRLFEKSKYESSTPFRSKKGDRFSDI